MPTENRNAKIVSRSLAAVWHPCTQMKHHERFPLVPIVKGEGVWLIDAEGNRYLDAVSSWWVNLFGHANPRINAALKGQLDQLEHAMLAGFTHEPAIELSERLAKLTGLGHAFYGSDGASAVEIALKMSFHFWRNTGHSDKKKFVSLQGSYHGETIGALAVTDVAIFRDAYGPLLNNNLSVPFPSGNSTEFSTEALERLLTERHHEIAAIIVEPLVQGAAGMRMYNAAWLTRARELCTRHGVHLIADEIMTGFGRTGTMFACEQAGIRPDFICLSKGITGGYLPLSCVLTTDAIYAAFYDDDIARGFLHSHSYTGSALACRAALATLDIFESDHVIDTNIDKSRRFTQHAEAIRAHPRVENFRHLGMIWAFEVTTRKATFAREFFAAALKRGALLRPIGKTVYFMPPYVVTEDEFAWLVAQTLATLDEIAPRMTIRTLAAGSLFCWAFGSLAQTLPPAVADALLKAQVPLDSVSVVVREVGAKDAVLTLNADKSMNPASVIKLVTTYAGLELLGPAYTWKTEVLVAGDIRQKTLRGDLVLKGFGDPKLSVERFWLLLRQLRERGLTTIEGDLVLDRSFFQSVPDDPGKFDGEPLRAYNVAPDPLLLNFKTVRFFFAPSVDEKTVSISPDVQAGAT